jgi:1-deoxy-D-xylulose-5-phosphate synthase
MQGELLRPGADAVLLGVGPVLGACLAAADKLDTEGISVGVADARWVKPLDTALIDRLAGLPIITVEENTLEGGFGSAMLEYLERRGALADTRIHRIGFPDRFIPHATRDEQLADQGLDARGIARTVRVFLAQHAPQPVK